jgi:hypothetical protein
LGARRELRGSMLDSVDAKALKRKLMAVAETLSWFYFNDD